MRLLTLLLALPLAVPAHAQSVAVSGRVLRGGPTGAPLARHWAVLHRIDEAAAGPLDSVRTDAAGRYVLRLARVDSAAHYFVSADYAGIGYFSSPVDVDHGPRSEVPALLVYDTTSAGPPIALRRRLVTIGLPGADGTREVLELLELLNVGTRTRVSPDSVQAVWSGALPAEAIQFRAGESDMSPSAILRVADSVAVFAPLPPGQLHQVTYQYYLPANVRTLLLPIDQPVTDFNLLLEDTTAVVSGTALDTTDTQSIEGRRFIGFRADNVPGQTAGKDRGGGAGTFVTVAFSAPPFRVDRLVPWIAGAAALALGVGLWVALRKKPSAGRATVALATLALAAGVAACSDALDANTAIGLEVAVANASSGSVTVVDLQDFTTETVALAPGATPTTLAARDTLLLVALGDADALGILPPAGAPRVVPLAPGSAATGVAFQDDSIGWVGQLGLDRVTRVNYVDGDTSSVAVGPAPRAVVLPGNGRLYVVNSNTPGSAPAGPSSISWFDLTGGVTPGGTIALTGANARYAAVGDDGLIYVVTSGTPGAGDGKVVIVDPATNVELAVINGLGESPGPAVYHPSGRLLIASPAHGILEVNTERRSLVRGPGQGITPGGGGVSALAIDPRGRVYAAAPGACTDPGQLYLLQAPPDYRVIETVPVELCPSAVAIVEMPPID